jgi:hypothetical protein
MNNQTQITRTVDFHPKAGCKYFQMEPAEDCLAVIK